MIVNSISEHLSSEGDSGALKKSTLDLIGSIYDQAQIGQSTPKTPQTGAPNPQNRSQGLIEGPPILKTVMVFPFDRKRRKFNTSKFDRKVVKNRSYGSSLHIRDIKSLLDQLASIPAAEIKETSIYHQPLLCIFWALCFYIWIELDSKQLKYRSVRYSLYLGTVGLIILSCRYRFRDRKNKLNLGTRKAIFEHYLSQFNYQYRSVGFQLKVGDLGMWVEVMVMTRCFYRSVAPQPVRRDPEMQNSSLRVPYSSSEGYYQDVMGGVSGMPSSTSPSSVGNYSNKTGSGRSVAGLSKAGESLQKSGSTQSSEGSSYRVLGAEFTRKIKKVTLLSKGSSETSDLVIILARCLLNTF